MANKSKTDMCIMFNANMVLTCLFLLIATSIPAAEMPQYSRLTSITANITSPNAIAVDNHENLYAVETTYNKLVIYSHRDEYVKTLYGLDGPISVAVAVNGRIFVGNHYDTVSNLGNVKVYDAGLNFLFKLGAGDGEFSQPNAIAVDGISGNIFVADKGADTVKVYMLDGTYNFSFDGTAGGGGQFTQPTSLTIDEANGEIIVLDRPLTAGLLDGARIQIFDMSGGFKKGFSRYGMGVGDMFKPKHLTVDHEGRIYVTDTEHSMVLVYDREGTYLGSIDDQNHPFRTPKGIAVNAANRLYVAELSLKSVEVYGLTPFTQMAVSPLSLTFAAQRGGAAAALQGIEISNSGTGTLNWTAEADESWITLSAIAGTIGPASVLTLNAGVDVSGLTEGDYTGSITIQSESGATETVNIGLTVTYSPLVINHGGPYAAQEGDMLTFDASGSSGDIILYEWDLDVDGSYDYSSASSTQGHIYPQIGTHYIKLRITDSVGASSEAITQVEISDSTPSAGFTASVTSGEVSLAVSFTNTTMGFDAPFTYEWDFDYDGTVDSTDESPSHVYNEVGTFSVKLTVMDSDGSVNALTRAFYITVTPQVPDSCQNAYVRIGAVDYLSIGVAYASSLNGHDILMRDGSYSAVSLNRNVSVKMTGGYDCDFSVPNGQTIINGGMVINSGTLTVDSGTIILN